MKKIEQTPLNKNQISQLIGLDYKAVEHHLDVLEKNNLVQKIGSNYGTTYFLSPILESNLKIFEELASQSKNCKENLK